MIHYPHSDFLRGISEHPLASHSDVQPLASEDRSIPTELPPKQLHLVAQFLEIANLRLIATPFP
jgi:hypothetical protein